ncbi:neutral/alkaline ceramidase [Aliikangiella coralliicola]|uniref:Neutral ceramidase n=1 Tax=Aliikangiella coralliicola TaxID=2592383 RepID=A0A545U6C3_9GAMM|nr:neutral/alkaline ceramidase [Aliikangiella coralliicola]TQV85016.1 alkaline ceramidase [Aliikangiella coralliicola]
MPTIKLAFLTVLLFLTFPCKGAESTYQIGTGIYDITGPAAEIGLYGYVNESQIARGIHQRLRSRAFIVNKPSTNKRIVFVSADVSAIFPAVKLEVVKRLAATYGTLYTHDNVMLTATHTHTGPGGSGHHGLFVLASITGYSPQNFEAVVNGIVQSIERAHANLAPGSIKFSRGELTGAALNRSLTAYNQNPDKTAYPKNTNTDMTLLKFVKDGGQEIGMIDWFSTHNTSFSKNFTLISGDHKGHASYLFEQDKGTDYRAAETFVAAFANSDEGDTVPSDGNAFSMPGFQGSSDEYSNTQAAALKQYQKAVTLYSSATEAMDGALDYRHKWVNMNGYQVNAAYTGTTNKQLCQAARGFSMLAGGENGPANIPGIYEGMVVGGFNMNDALAAADNFIGSLIQLILGAILLGTDDPCQHPKPVFMPTGSLGLEPQILPFQIFVIDKLAIIAVPAEITTMSGRRLRAKVLATLANEDVDYAVIAGLANSYSGYLSTFEEYQVQHYEGASTLFGPHTHHAYEQIFNELSTALANGTAITGSATPVDLSSTASTLYQSPGVAYDDKRLFESFGQVMQGPNATYTKGNTVTVTFRAGHPKNNLKIQDSFIKIQKRVGFNWVTIAEDWDWSTRYEWRRDTAIDCLACSFVDAIWTIPSNASSGIYRIQHDGHWKQAITGTIFPYSGASTTFTVN